MTIEFRCAQCRQHLRVPDSAVGNNARCPQCQTLLQIPSDTLHGRPGLPWERRGSFALVKFIQTALLVAFRPLRAFEQMRQRGSYAGPMMYSALGLLIGVMGLACLEGLAAYYTLDQLPARFPETLTPELIALIKQWLPLALVAMAVIGVPLAVTLGNLINAGLMHAALLIAGGSQQSFATTFRIVCYVQPSLTWLMFIPFGSLLLGVWTAIVSVIAVMKAHEVSLGRAIVAVILPMMLTSLVIGLILIAFIIGLATMFAANSQH